MNTFFLIISVLFVNGATAIDDSTKQIPCNYCKPRIIGMSPNKVISIGWDNEFSQTLKSSDIGSFQKKDDVKFIETTHFKQVNGFRFNAKVPLINKPALIWQIGLNYSRANYVKESATSPPVSPKFGAELRQLTSSGVNTSVYKPLNSKSFLIFQISADLNGDYSFSDLHPLKYLKYSLAGMYGQRLNERTQWAVGLARAYAGGQLTVLPLAMFNYTAPGHKWGVEILLPSRALYRYTLNKISVLRIGYELEGASYRLLHINNTVKDMELRRGQLRSKIEYQHKLYKSFWVAVQTGYSYVLNYNIQYLGADKNEFSKEVFRQKKYNMINDLSDFMYLNLAINFVSL